jgi:hypothetical protein
LEAADFRTQLIYAANAPAELSVSAGEGCVVYYTTDGSAPTVDGDTAKIASDGKITVDAPNKASTVTVKAIAVKDGKASEVTEKTLHFIAVPDAGTGTKVYLGTAVCPGKVGKPYDVKVKVTVVNGIIRKIEDNGTAPSDFRDEMYFEYLYSSRYGDQKTISQKLSGKDFTELLNAKTTAGNSDYNVDAVSKATISSDAVKYACVAAMQSEPIETSDDQVLLPVVTPSKSYASVVANSNWANIRVVASGADNTKLYYTTDGTTPTAASTEYTPSVSVNYDYKNYPDGQKVPFKVVAIDDQNNASRVVTLWLVFAKPQTENPYKVGTYTQTTGEITATAVIAKASGTSATFIQSITLDDASAKKYADFLPELRADVYYHQSANLTGTYSADQQAVLNAIEAALQQARA